MYRVMIIDDERALRNLLKASVDWESLGFEVVGEAGSGIEAINTIDRYQPDLVFVDIRMPFMDGIEFAKLALERYERMKIVILTAFDEFEYARRCIGMGISAYLLKPIVRNDIIDVCTKVAAELGQRSPEDEDVQFGKDVDLQRVKEYIEENVTNPSLNITSVSQAFGYNSNYLGRRFKEVFGMSATDFVLSCRMEKAKKYIQQGKPMYMTSKEVGIPDPNYFGKCFKKYTGLSYREMLNAQEENINE